MFEELPPGSTIVLVDSSAILKSCFEGYKNPRTSSYKGRALDVAGLFGYMYRVQKVYENFEFDALVHIIDPPGGSYYRYNLFPEYKGNRKADDPVFAAHKALLPQTLAAFGERVLQVRGVESDDVIGTLAQQCAQMGHEVTIISPDKDLLQLVVEDQISIARYIDDPSGFGKTYETYETVQDVVRKLGVRPDQVADFLALVGDSADNIPGVFKVGPGTAQKWLNEHGDLMTLMTNAGSIKGKVGDNLREALPLLPLYQKSTSVLLDVPNLGIPLAPQPTDEEHLLHRELLVLKDDFPTRFVVGGTPAPYAPPARTHTSAPARTPAQDELSMPEGDALSQPQGAHAQESLGSAFQSSPTAPGNHASLDTGDPFAELGVPDPAPEAPRRRPRPFG